MKWFCGCSGRRPDILVGGYFVCHKCKQYWRVGYEY